MTTLAGHLRAAAAAVPGRVFVRAGDGAMTYAECLARVHHLARGVRAAGVARGDAVVLVMENSTEQVALWLALGTLDVLHAPVNPALTGPYLAHAVRTAGAALVLADPALADRVRRALAGERVEVPVRTTAELPDGPAVAPVDVDELTTATLLFTSGTTGPAKACALSHRYLVRQAEIHVETLGLREDDVLFCPFPLFHIDAATLTVGAALVSRSTAALGTRFSARGFWDEVRAADASVVNFMGATLSLLWKAPPDTRDRDHRVRLDWGVPLPEWAVGFEERFGLELRTLYGLTDGGVSVYEPWVGARRAGTCGRAVSAYEVRVDTAQARPGDPAGTGEILIRGREPGLVMNGYHGQPEASAAAFDDEGWLRTGDLGSLDADGFLTFRGRLTDSIRRRGENISAFEVEELLLAHPDVVEAAAVGVPSELTEEDVLGVVVLRAGSPLTMAELHADCLARGPRHMTPRYLRVVDALPRTPTAKLEKFRLRETGLAPSTYDAGVGR